MLCQNCGSTLPTVGKFCPFCGAVIERSGLNDETAILPTVPDDFFDPIHHAASDTAQEHEEATRVFRTVPAPSSTARPRVAQASTPPSRTAKTSTPPTAARPARTGARPRSTATSHPAPQRIDQRGTTTYFEHQRPRESYRKPRNTVRGVVIALIAVVMFSLIGGGVYLIWSNRPNESIALAEKYMARGRFDDALTAYEQALLEVKDSAVIQLEIDRLRSYQQAQAFFDRKDYTAAIATLNDLRSRIPDKTSPLGEAVDRLLEKAGQSDSLQRFSDDFTKAQSYFDAEQYEQCAAVLQMLEDDTTLSDEQRRQVSTLREQLDQAQQLQHRQEQNEKLRAEKKQAFSERIAALEEKDQTISSAQTLEEEYDLTAASFEEWDSLLADLYDHLASQMNADSYAAEEERYQQWVEERDSGAAEAAKKSTPSIEPVEPPASDPTPPSEDWTEEQQEALEEQNRQQEQAYQAYQEQVTQAKLSGQLASASFKQSFTKTRCYKILDMIDG